MCQAVTAWAVGDTNSGLSGDVGGQEEVCGTEEKPGKRAGPEEGSMTLYQGGREGVPAVGSIPKLASEALSPEAVVSHQLLPHPVP